MVLALLQLALHVAASAVAADSNAAKFEISDLSTEYLLHHAEEPLVGIDVPEPRFGWLLLPTQLGDAAARGAVQVAYRVRLYRGADTSAPGAVLVWDSGKQASNRTQQVAAAAAAELVSDALYAWEVAAWDGAGGAAVARNASFRTGLLGGAAEFHARGAAWLTPGKGRNLLRSPVLALPAAAADPVRQATVHLAGVGYFELTVNGARVGPGRKMDVAWTAYAQRVNYVSFDLAPFLTAGADNVLGVALGNSWFSLAGWYQQPPYLGCDAKATAASHGQGTGTCNGGGYSYDVPNQLLLSARVVLASGAELSLTSGAAGWTAGAGPITSDSLYDGEDYDARLEQPGWDAPGRFEWAEGAAARTALGALPWAAAAAVPDASNVLLNSTLSAQLMEPIRVVQKEGPVARWLSPGGNSTIFDFGRNLVGVVRLRVRQPVAGRTVTLRHAEAAMHPPYGPRDGSLYYGSLRNVHQTDRYTMRGGDGTSSDDEVFEPRFTTHGFRYLELWGLGYDPEDADVMRLVVHSDVRSRSAFAVPRAGPAAVLNQISGGLRNSLLGNTLGGPGSCAARDERMFFTGDTNFAVQAHMLSFDVAAVYTHWLQTVADQQRPSGAVGDYAPDVVGDARSGHSNWGGGFLAAVHAMWHHYGDTRVVETHLPRLEAYGDFQEGLYNATAASGLAHFWPDGALVGWITLGPLPNASLMAAYGYVESLRMLADLASAAGAPTAAAYRARHAARLATFHASFYDAGGAGRVPGYGSSTQDELALALALGAPPDAATRAAVADSLAAQIEFQRTLNIDGNSSTASKSTAMAGGVGIKVLYEALAAAGRGDVALRLATKTTFPSHGYMFTSEAEPATSLWEQWATDSLDPSEGSRNHIFFSSVAGYFYKVLGGITAATAGYERAVIAPTGLGVADLSAAGLTSCDTAVGTPRGQITSSWSLISAPARAPNVTTLTPVYRLAVVVPVGVVADVVVPLRGSNAAAVALTESGADVWREGKFVAGVPGVSGAKAADAGQGGNIRVAVTQGSYSFELLESMHFLTAA